MRETAFTNKEIARAMKLRYTPAGTKGYKRIKKGNKFSYLDKEGKQISDREVIAHIQGLVLPPAWEEVWICPFPNGHLQATGIDSRGRKQYRYHAQWAQIRNLKKFDRLYAFGRKLPLLRKQIRSDLRRKKLVCDKVCAIAISIMMETHIRAGNTSYEKEYGSFGLSTLKNRHVNISGTKAFFKFKGKKGVLQQIYLKDASLVRLLKNIRELPGQELFQYYDEEGHLQKLDSGDINEYLKCHMKEEFTCKDFRTWSGCVLALLLMAQLECPLSAGERKKQLISVIDEVAGRLGNTRAVTRNYYIHPKLQLCYLEGRLDPVLAKLKRVLANTKDPVLAAEKVLLSFLKRLAHC